MEALLSIWMPVDASAHGWQIDRLIVWVHWLMALLFVGWGLYFVYVLYRFRASANPEASYGGARSHASQYVEGGVAIAEVILLVGFAIPAWAMWVTPPPDDADPVVVRVVAQQFAWNIHYPGPDGEFGPTSPELITPQNAIGLDRDAPAARDDVVTLNQLHLPVDRDIVVRLASRDVIHSFYLPQMRVKQDAVPGMEIPVYFRATMVTPEENRSPQCAADQTCWEIACAQLCGYNHYRMRGFYTIHSQAGFDAWMAERVAQVTGQTAVLAE